MPFTEIERTEEGTCFLKESRLSLGSPKLQMSMRSTNRAFKEPGF